MELTYDWEFNPLESYPTASGQTDVVFLVHWQVNAYTGSYGARSIGIQSVTYNPETPFVAYQDLTKEMVYGWVTASMGEDQYNQVLAGLESQISNQINPPVLIQQAPWIPQGPTI